MGRGAVVMTLAAGMVLPTQAPTAARTPNRNLYRFIQRGPWGRPAGSRLTAALRELGESLPQIPGVIAVIVFGSYARAEAGASSDVDLLVLFDGNDLPEQTDAGRAALAACGAAEATHRLPMHLSPLLASVKRPETLGNGIRSAVLAEGVVLYGSMPHLTAWAAPPDLAPAAVISYRLGHGAARERVRLHRRLFGYTTSTGRHMAGLVQAPGRRLGSGVIMVPRPQRTAVVRALREVGALYNEELVWTAASPD